MRRALVASLALLALGAFTWLLIRAMLTLPAGVPVALPQAVGQQLEASGVAHPVTAVLLNFRGYDTLLEVAVLLVALLGVVVVVRPERGVLLRPGALDRVAQSTARVLVPIMLVVAGYLLWAGAYRPGGAFQAAAIVAAAAVLLNLVRLLPSSGVPGPRLRAGLAAGLLLFIAFAAPVHVPDTLLAFPPARAAVSIFAIEASLSVSLGLLLGALFLCLARDRPTAAAGSARQRAS